MRRLRSVALALALVAAGCGLKGDPVPPEPKREESRTLEESGVPVAALRATRHL